MSKDRSRTTPPTTNTSPRNPSNTERSTSRQQKHEPSPSHGERPQKTPPSPPPPTAGSSRTRPLEEDETTEEQPMAKRLRRDSTAQEAGSDRSSPSSDSQSGLADTEETERGHQSERSNLPPTAPKKKRTRTLTTPHQSAVLHALLAQSRFPTTAMREEVGRAIGLSARKVQIWFQNQRQKARRPRTQNETPARPQYQYGPFPTASDPDANLYPRSQTHLGRPPMGSTLTHEPEGRYDPGFLSQSAMTLPPARLSGPAMPGYGSPSDPLARNMPLDIPPIAGPSHTIPQPRYGIRSPSPTRVDPSQVASSSRSLSRHQRDPSRILPPLVFPSPTHTTMQSSIRSAPATLPPPLPFHHRSLSPEVLARQSTESRMSTTFPPPFTLQPQPQWDNSVFTTVPPGGASGWRGPQVSREESTSPTTFRSTERIERVPEEPEESINESPSSMRGGRYDPVRGSVVPYEPSPPPRTPPAT
ncbi:hypothetical protein V5O48_005788 [Marasmius crinis-equi]|uniref:Homeobox domain-containing protein n=1 Tax=Marasmius crinis-equi TaxID=585013 RepID=A0ABR3FLQ4_9AGAR